MQTDGQTDMTKLIVAFSSFANAPENGVTVGQYVCSCVLQGASNITGTICV
jgi:hypothetical protein